MKLYRIVLIKPRQGGERKYVGYRLAVMAPDEQTALQKAVDEWMGPFFAYHIMEEESGVITRERTLYSEDELKTLEFVKADLKQTEEA